MTGVRLIIVGSILGRLAVVHGDSSCREGVLSPANAAKIAEYVAESEPALARRTVEVNVVETDQSTCYRTLKVIGTRNGSLPVVKTFYLSPDERILATQVFDLSKPPVPAGSVRSAQFKKRVGDSTNPSLGRKDAPVTINVFSDFQCPFCRAAADILVKEVLPVEQDNVRLVFNHLPLPMHSWARMAAESTACISELSIDEFWAAHDWLFANQATLTQDTFEKRFFSFVESRGIELPKIRTCVAERRGAAAVERDLLTAAENSIQSTPTLFLNGFRVVGVQNAEQMRTLVRQAMRTSVNQAGISEQK